MKQHFKISFTIAVAICGLITNCKADTVDNYQIYIGKTLMLTEASFNPLRSTFPVLRLDTSNYSEIININFNHCTHGASGRQLKLTDTADKTIMAWKFSDKDEKPLMSIPINEILTNSSINTHSSYKLYYVDKEYPVWRLLTSVFVGQKDIRKTEAKASSFKFDKTFLFCSFGGLTFIYLMYRFARQRSPNR